MNADLSQILTFGLGAVLLATTLLALLVSRDLAPSGAWGGALDGGGRWFLGAALGVGVIAFSLKLLIILTLATYPDHTIQPLLAGPDRHDGRPPLDPASGAAQRPLWVALPLVAPSPQNNPPSPAKVRLGDRLFHDPGLSSTGTIACASCHDVRTGAGTDGRATAIGVTAVPGRRNSPSVFDAAFMIRLFWDGRAASLEEQAKGPLTNPDEMGLPSLDEAVNRLARQPSYRAAFAEAFDGDDAITIDRMVQAIAAFERTLTSGQSPYDRFVLGDTTALTPSQQRGMALFEAIGCATCHSGPTFSGAGMTGPRSPFALLRASGHAEAHRLGLVEDKGRAAPGSPVGVWRVPSLRNVAVTAPYFHNGSVADLNQAVRLMAEIQLGMTTIPTPAKRQWRWSPDEAAFALETRTILSDDDIVDIVSFLRALTGDRLARVTGH